MKRKPTIDNEHLYKKFWNLVANELKTSRLAYHNQYFQTHKDNMKKLWSGVRSIINIKQNVNFQVSQLTVNGIEVTDPQKITSEFNKYFISVPKQVDKGIPFTRKSPVDYLQNRVDNSFFLSPADPNEIEAIMLSFNNYKSVRLYSVSIKLLKSLSKSASESLTLIVNDSFNRGIYPNKLKTAEVVALHKKGASDNSTNYRPISTLYNVCSVHRGMFSTSGDV